MVGSGGRDSSVLVVAPDAESGTVFDRLTGSDAGFGVEAAGPATALDAVDRDPVDCVVARYDLAAMDGLELLGRVRKRAADLPFVLVDGTGSPSVAREAVAAGATAYVPERDLVADPASFVARVAAAVETADDPDDGETSPAPSPLERKLQRYEALVEDLPVGVFRTGANGTIEQVNGALVRLLGGESRADLLDRDPTAFYVDPAKREELLHRLQTHGTVYDEELQLQTLDGETIWASATIRLDHRDGRQYLEGIVSDVSERKDRERELRRSERRFEAVFEDPNILVGLLDTDGTVLDANETALDYVAADREEVVGTPFPETPWWDEEMRPVVERRVRRAATGEHVEFEADLTRPDGGSYSVTGSIRPVEDDDGEVVSLLVSGRDVTERKRRNQQLEGLDRVLRHNLHNEMNIILGTAESIAEEVDGPVAERAARIVESGQQLLDLTRKQRDIVRLLSEAPDWEAVDVAGIVDRAVADLGRRYPDAEVTVEGPETAVATGIPQFEVAVTELLENAIEHADDRTPTVDIQHGTETVEVSVADDGPGIPDPEQAILHGEGESGPLYHGSGMGLWLVNWVVSYSGGHIEYADSDEGQSVVTISLPRAGRGEDRAVTGRQRSALPD